MPSMRHELKLEPAGAGTYAGGGDIEMAGKWEGKAFAQGRWARDRDAHDDRRRE